MSVSTNDRGGIVAAHVATCEECGAGGDAERIERNAQRVESLLASMPAPLPPAHVQAMSAAVLGAAAPLLAAHARRVYGRRLVAALAVAIAPLPLVYACGAWALGALYALLAALTSESIAAVAVSSYASLLVLAIAAGCASIPLLVERSVPAAFHPPRRSIA